MKELMQVLPKQGLRLLLKAMQIKGIQNQQTLHARNALPPEPIRLIDRI